MEKVAREKKAFADRKVESHNPSSSFSDYWYYDECDNGLDSDCEEESPSILVDDKGFPRPLVSSGLQEATTTCAGTNRSIEIQKSEEEEEGEGDSFASDFYRCGTDWSSLLLSNDCQKKNPYPHNSKTMRPLKQTNLFEMWGFHSNKTNPKVSSDYNDQHPPQEDHNYNNINNAADADAAASILPHHPKKKLKVMPSASSSWSSNPQMKSSNSNRNAFVGASSNTSVVSGGPGTGRTFLTDKNNAGVASKQRPTRVCPFYKKIPGTPFTIDAFSYGRIEGCNAYILSHFHADHYGGLSKGWSHGPIYCTPLTARLVRMCLSVNPRFVHPLELGTEYVIEGIKVTMLEANHCPGAALIHLCLPNGQCYLHTGDFRANKLMHAYPLLLKQRVNVLYLDTTYCNPKYRFPSKEDVLDFVVRVTQNCLRKQPKTLIIVGAYSIGKECVYLAISKALGVKIYANTARRRILQSFGWPELSGNLCSHGKETPLHVVPISFLRFEVLERYMKTYSNQYTAALAFRPTGWTYSETIGRSLELIKPTSRGIVTIYGVPYSEHSNFTELRDFIKFLRPNKIIPTVNVGNAANRDKMQSYFQEWLRG